MQTGNPQSSTLPAVQRGEKRPGVIDCAAYAQGLRVATVAIADISEELKHEDRFVWVGLYEPDDKLLREIQDEFGLHDLAIEDAHIHREKFVVEEISRACAAERQWEFFVTAAPWRFRGATSSPVNPLAIF